MEGDRGIRLRFFWIRHVDVDFPQEREQVSVTPVFFVRLFIGTIQHFLRMATWDRCIVARQPQQVWDVGPQIIGREYSIRTCDLLGPGQAE